MNMAQQCARMSQARRLQVGAVIVKNDNILSFGWNGTPAGWDNDCEDKIYDLARDFNGNFFPDLEKEYPYSDEYGRYKLVTKPEVLHAEINSLMKLAKSTESGKGATLFITHAPCINCAKAIYQAGILEVYYNQLYRTTDGIDFLQKCNILVEPILLDK